MNLTMDIKNTRLTSAEIAQLWNAYLMNSASKQIFSYFANKAEDVGIYPLIDSALNSSGININNIKEILKDAGHPFPYGFRDTDVNANADRLFSDSFVLNYLSHYCGLCINIYSEALNVSSYSDIRKFFTDCLHSSIELSNAINDSLINKGVYIRPPYLEFHSEAEAPKKHGYISKLMSSKMPLNHDEITQIFINLKANMIIKMFTTGLSQTARSEFIRKHASRAREIAEKHINIFTEYLNDNGISYPETLDTDILDSSEPTFSDKLITFYITLLNTYSISLYGNALSKTIRDDIAVTFNRLSAETSEFMKDGYDIMIQNGWIEKIPEVVDSESSGV